MSKERLEEIKDKFNKSSIFADTKDIQYLIEQAELMQRFAKKNAELNEFLNEYGEVEHWGRNVIDVAMDIITKQDKEIEELKDDKVELYKLNEKIGVKAWDIEQQNKRYHETIKKSAMIIKSLPRTSGKTKLYNTLIKALEDDSV